MKAITSAIIVFFSWAILPVQAATSIDAVNRYAYGANIGWIDWSGGTGESATGAVMGDYVCSGYIYSANVGWINLGSGSPANGIQYQNSSANDFGVNQDGLGDLNGYAWGANIGWITFEQTYGKPKIDLLTGSLSGDVWSANCGWISLSNAEAYVQTDYLYPGPLAPDGLPIPWLLNNFGTTNVNANADPTGKGMTIGQDYVAGTNPNNVNSVLRIVFEEFTEDGSGVVLTWDSEQTRLYYILSNTNLTTATWVDAGLGSGLGLIAPTGSTTTRIFNDKPAPSKFYRVQAIVPLSP